MIVVANTPQLKDLAQTILLQEAGVRSTPDMQAIMWANKETKSVEWVVGYDGFVGKVCQIHVVNCAKKSAPRKLVWVAFHYAFIQAEREALIGLVNSKNAEAMRFNKHLGFKEISRLPGLHDDGGDLVLFKMNKSECKWIKERKYEAELVTA